MVNARLLQPAKDCQIGLKKKMPKVTEKCPKSDQNDQKVAKMAKTDQSDEISQNENTNQPISQSAKKNGQHLQPIADFLRPLI